MRTTSCPTLALVVDDAMISRVLEIAVEARERGDHPFGALLEVDGEIVAEAGNRVVSDQDITAHAELTLVRDLERLYGAAARCSRRVCSMRRVSRVRCASARCSGRERGGVVFALSHERLNRLAAAPDAEPFGFTISAPEIGRRANPPMTFDGPHREDEAALAHDGFWH